MDEADRAVEFPLELLRLPPVLVASITLVSKELPSRYTTVWGPVGNTSDTEAVLMDVDVWIDPVMSEGEAKSSEADESCARMRCAARREDDRNSLEYHMVRAATSERWLVQFTEEQKSE